MAKLNPVHTIRRRYPKNRKAKGVTMVRDGVEKLAKLASLLEGTEFDITAFSNDHTFDYDGDENGQRLNIAISVSLKVR